MVGVGLPWPAHDHDPEAHMPKIEQPHRPARRGDTLTEPLSGQPWPAEDGTSGPRPVQQVLADAIAVMTEAARLTWTRTDGDGQTVTVRGDWAEFVTLALAGAAANVGGIEDALVGRPGSWEADHVRNLLTSTVGEEEQQLLGHRTEPVVVDVFVDDIMVDLGTWQAYDDAQQELTRRYADCTSATTAESSNMPTPTFEREQRLDELAELEERLDNQRLRDWTEYGQELKTQPPAAGRCCASRSSSTSTWRRSVSTPNTAGRCRTSCCRKPS
jgi:hypothetical protein